MLSRRKSMVIGLDLASTIASSPASSSNPRMWPGGGLAADDVQTVESTLGYATTRTGPPARGILRNSASGPTNFDWGGGGAAVCDEFGAERSQATSARARQRKRRTQNEGQRDQVQKPRWPGVSMGIA